ncbi:replication-associated recombination protein A [Ruminococcus sp.]|uniref:replication-associated recombination protein A n=1 Tax=Ruminococcus sp. TaxID=41978 RepID=UPI00258CB18E|nr:replication-associated recombination protein A [Ruminococcus sp.]MCR5022377.1 replication-associated recombination protein A [Ruminococcus sp.]
MSIPLAERIRPKTLDEIVGQPHLMGVGKPLRRIIESGTIPNLIFYGPSGVGKTTIARFIAENANMTMYKLNGTSASVADIKQIIAETEMIGGMNGILLYLDEIQYLNKKQQQSLLEYIENGKITLISSTTENPYFYVYNAIISRSTVFEFKPVTPEQISPAIKRAFDLMAQDIGTEVILEEGVIEHIARGCGGDVRKSVNTVELCVLSAENGSKGELHVKMDTVRELTQRSNMRYDREGDEHYDILSALQKSIRGSDENAAIHYAARLIEAGDIISLCRRLLVIASEDVGLAYPMAAVITKSCVDSALQLGLPEARIPLAEAVIMLATSPKSNSAYKAINSALEDVKNSGPLDFPRHLQNKHFDGADAKVRGQHYLYPHDYPDHWVKQQYLPDALKNRVYYEYGENKAEQAAKAYWTKIKGDINEK